MVYSLMESQLLMYANENYNQRKWYKNCTQRKWKTRLQNCIYDVFNPVSKKTLVMFEQLHYGLSLLFPIPSKCSNML